MNGERSIGGRVLLGRNHKYRKGGGDDDQKEEHFFKVAGKLLRRGRGNILGLSVERRSPAGCAPGFEVLCCFSPAHETPPHPSIPTRSIQPSISAATSLQRERTRRGHGQLCEG